MSYLNDVFGPGGLLANRFQGYVPREGQMALAGAVDAAINGIDHLLVEAPTGTGKSIGYSVPAIYHATQERKKVLIVTGNIALQEQLVKRDLPLLRDILPWNFNFALMKGINNYICQDRIYQEDLEGTLTQLDDPADQVTLNTLLAWAQVTVRGDVTELPIIPHNRLWKKFSTTSGDCKGSDCKFALGRCYARRAREEAGAADVIVANYHLFFINLALKEEIGKDVVLPRADVVILDEAHKAADIARNVYGQQITQGAVRWAARHLKRIGGVFAERLHEDVIDESSKFFIKLDQFRKAMADGTRIKEPNNIPGESLVKILSEVADTYTKAIQRRTDPDLTADLQLARKRCLTISEHLRSAMDLDDPEVVVFLEADGRSRTALCTRQIHVAARIRANLFDTTDTVILTSATLAIDNEFDHVRGELGVPDEATEMVVDTPFDMRRQSLLIVPDDMPSATSKDFTRAVAEATARIIQLADGRTMGLFTSYKNLEAAYARVSRMGYRVMKQGDMPRTKLVDEFRRDVRSVLLGTESFWSGVDVPGEALSCLIMDRLPFPSPSDPVLDAISEQDDNWFWNYSLPRAVISFKQGFGRLIRTVTDRGVVVVLDERIVTKGYGELFFDSIPDVSASTDLEDIRNFLNDAQQGASWV